MKTKLIAVLVGVSAATFAALIFLNSIVLVHIVYILGGAFYLAAPFSRKRSRSRWARGLFLLTGCLLVALGTVDLLRYYALWMPPTAVQHAILSLIPIVNGIVLGLLLALIVSGELVGRKIWEVDRSSPQGAALERN